MSTSASRRFELGEDYRLSQLHPGVVVVRQVSHSTSALSSGSPCCLRTSTINHEVITGGQREYAKYGVGGLRHRRRCAGCGGHYAIHVPAEGAAQLLRTVAWEVRP